jgi:hypothetical protein
MPPVSVHRGRPEAIGPKGGVVALSSMTVVAVAPTVTAVALARLVSEMVNAGAAVVSEVGLDAISLWSS